MTSIRLNKYLAQSGIASRRKADDIISSGRVTINGKIEKRLGTIIQSESDKVAVDGKLLKLKQSHVAYIFYKPVDVISTLSDELDRTSLRKYFPDDKTLFSVGRLDRMSEGLLIFTNDGEMAMKLTHPRYQIPKKYRIFIHKSRAYSASMMTSLLQKSYRLGDKLRAFDSVAYCGMNDDSLIFEVVVHEGIYHEVKRLVDRAGLTVSRLIRTEHGPFKLGTLLPGDRLKLTEVEYQELRANVENSSNILRKQS
jgi:23S rRNA pseudouridine2605 synthase